MTCSPTINLFLLFLAFAVSHLNPTQQHSSRRTLVRRHLSQRPQSDLFRTRSLPARLDHDTAQATHLRLRLVNHGAIGTSWSSSQPHRHDLILRVARQPERISHAVAKNLEEAVRRNLNTALSRVRSLQKSIEDPLLGLCDTHPQASCDAQVHTLSHFHLANSDGFNLRRTLRSDLQRLERAVRARAELRSVLIARGRGRWELPQATMDQLHRLVARVRAESEWFEYLASATTTEIQVHAWHRMRHRREVEGGPEAGIRQLIVSLIPRFVTPDTARLFEARLGTLYHILF